MHWPREISRKLVLAPVLAAFLVSPVAADAKDVCSKKPEASKGGGTATAFKGAATSPSRRPAGAGSGRKIR